MRPKDYKGRCVRQSLSKCSEIVRTYDKVQTAFARMLEDDTEVSSFQCNVPLEDFSEGNYTTDFLCIRTNGDYFVRACVYRRKLILPRTAKLLDGSRTYWLNHGIEDWGIIVETEEASHEE